MALQIRTFSNKSGGETLFKALGHPLAAPAAAELVQKIRAARHPVLYDPLGQASTFAALHGLSGQDVRQCFVRDSFALEGETLGHRNLPITELPASGADLVLIAAFDSEPLLEQIAQLLPPGCQTLSFDAARLPDRLLTDRRNYLHRLNFATNFAFFREQGGCSSRLVTANYWGGYGAKAPFLWCRLFGADGETLLDFEQPLGEPNSTAVIDSRQLRAEHGLEEFCGQLFVSVIGGAGHDVVKYVLDIDGAEADLSCTHDANAWPSDLYAGLPAPADGEQVVLWVQNSHPAPIPPGEIGLNVMGDDSVIWLDEEIAPFATRALDVRQLLPAARWPQQLEIRAGKWFVRPRYEITRDGRRRINHPNVERSDLGADEQIRRLAAHLGKGFILPAPVLPPGEYHSQCLPTPMASAQRSLPLQALVYSPEGEEIARRPLGDLPRDHCELLDLDQWLPDLPEAGGHLELIYDLEHEQGHLDGWIHALFRYTDRESGHAADTSFGSHLFNHLLTFRNEPQSYKGPPPGLSTRLFLRLPPAPTRAFCQLIYPVCERWHPHSDTALQLHDAAGQPIAEAKMQIPASGSRLFYLDEVFAAEDMGRASGGYVLVRDTSCRLFGYHGVRRDGGFALDHTFGF